MMSSTTVASGTSNSHFSRALRHTLSGRKNFYETVHSSPWEKGILFQEFRKPTAVNVIFNSPAKKKNRAAMYSTGPELEHRGLGEHYGYQEISGTAEKREREGYCQPDNAI